MSIFRDIAEIIYEAYDANERWNAEVDKYRAQIAEKDARKIREKQQLKEAIERKGRELYWTQFFNDPDSVKICPYGWSPFGFYL
jgi:hypothetical protein